MTSGVHDGSPSPAPTTRADASGVAPQRLRLASVSKTFPGVRALDAVDLAVRPGEVHGLVGENGAGKSTLMAVAAGALVPDDGEVLVDGVALEPGSPAAARERGIAIVRQHPELMPDLTVAENLVLGLGAGHTGAWTAGRLHAWADERLRAWRDDYDVAVDARVASLRPDQRFVVEIAKALAQRPAMLILDEPTEHLAHEDVEVLFRRVRELANRGTAVVYISHRIREVRRLADRITVLRDGRTHGTYGADELDEHEVVELIVGRPIDTAFPAKRSAASPSTPVLELRGFEGEGFAAVDLTVAAGEIVGLAGIEGNGQRELLRALAGLVPARGELMVAGRDVSLRTTEPSARRAMAYVPGDRHREGMLPESSVRDNIALRHLGRLSRAGFVAPGAQRLLAADAVERFDIKAPSLETPMGTLSGGNQQKAVLASVLGTRPWVLLADEPTQGVDVGARVEIYSLLRRFADEGRAVLLVASDALELEGLCDRVIVLSRGRVAARLAGDEVTETNITSRALTASATRERAARRSHRTRAWLASDLAPPALVAAAIVALAIYAASANELFLTARNLTGVLALTATLALAAIGQQLAMVVGGIDLSVGPVMGLLVVVESFFLTDGAGAARELVGWGLLVVVALFVGWVNWALVDLARLHPMVATLVTFMALQGVSLILRPTPGGLISSGLTATITTTWGPVPAIFVGAAIGTALLHVALRSCRLGIRLRGVGSNAEGARVAGVSPRRARLAAYVGCSLLAGCAAVPLLAQVGSGDPAAGVDYTLASVAAAVIGGASIFGGRGSILGCLLGALLIQEIASVTTFLQLDAAWQSYVLGGMTLLAVAVYSTARRGEEAHA